MPLPGDLCRVAPAMPSRSGLVIEDAIGSDVAFRDVAKQLGESVSLAQRRGHVIKHCGNREVGRDFNPWGARTAPTIDPVHAMADAVAATHHSMTGRPSSKPLRRDAICRLRSGGAPKSCTGAAPIATADLV